MNEAPDGAPDSSVFLAGRAAIETRAAAQIAPAAACAVDVREIEFRVVQETLERRFGAEAAKFGQQAPLVRADALSEVLKNEIAADLVKLDRASGRKEGKSLFDLLRELAARASGQSAEAQVVAETPVGRAVPTRRS